MEGLIRINDAVNRIVWGAPMLALLIGVGLLLTIRTRGFQFRRFGYAMKNTLGKIFGRKPAGAGEITPFQAMTTALAGTVGTGSIAGVTAAVTLGGPGAIFWLWMSALIGMVTKYSEVLLAVKYRERNEHGEWVGGPMYYIRNGLGKKWARLGSLFCIFAALASFGTGNAVQVGNITTSVVTVITTFSPDFARVDLANLIIGGVVTLLAAVVLFGGIKRLGAVTERLVPAMAVIYVLASLAVVALHVRAVPGVLAAIFQGAFSPAGVTGGAVGSGLLALSWGLKRGVFSNEAGLGSAPMAHATTSEKDPVLQGLYGIFEVFMATIVICTLTGLALLCSGVPIPYGTMGDTSLNVAALGTVFGGKGGSLVIAIGISLFAFSTILGWALYGMSCCQYLWGYRAVLPFKIVFLSVIFLSSALELSLVWDIADTLNGLMAIPNLVGLLGLSGVVVRETRKHFEK
ncbi:MAG: sodium:alanine symporter family protein [Ruminiclostridium sp.]|nr:sodium:alanine symporter family protein [Ruminiclostridium sp.]